MKRGTPARGRHRLAYVIARAMGVKVLRIVGLLLDLLEAGIPDLAQVQGEPREPQQGGILALGRCVRCPPRGRADHLPELGRGESGARPTMREKWSPIRLGWA